MLGKTRSAAAISVQLQRKRNALVLTLVVVVAFFVLTRRRTEDKLESLEPRSVLVVPELVRV
jgi:hypothetical protein